MHQHAHEAILTNPHTLNVASTWPSTTSLGPGTRAVVWVQGCPFQCPGCVSPDWIPFHKAREVTPAVLAKELLADPNVTGLTFSGGEPMMQAAGLAEVIRLARRERDLSLICFSGFKLERLRSRPPSPGVDDLLAEIDVLIDGPYVAALNDNRGLRGSSNQRVHYLTDRLQHSDYDFEGKARQAEVHVHADSVTMVGVPPHHLLDTLTMFDPSETTNRIQEDPEAIRSLASEE